MKKKTCSCGGSIVPDRTYAEGFLIGCMKCDACGETLFTPKQTKELIRLRETNNRIEGRRKIIRVGSSIAALLPKKVESLGITEGAIDNIRVLSTNSLEITFSKEFL